MSRKQSGGHPARQDTDVDRLFRAMKQSTELVRTMEGKVSDHGMLCLKAAALGQMTAYAELTGLPAPIEIVFGLAS